LADPRGHGALRGRGLRGRGRLLAPLAAAALPPAADGTRSQGGGSLVGHEPFSDRRRHERQQPRPAPPRPRNAALRPSIAVACAMSSQSWASSSSPGRSEG
jgi:hypothetical protein